jgi:hypothetical protein
MRKIPHENSGGLARSWAWENRKVKWALRLAMLPMPGTLRSVSVFAIGFGAVGSVTARVSVAVSFPRVNITASRRLSGRWYL